MIWLGFGVSWVLGTVCLVAALWPRGRVLPVAEPVDVPGPVRPVDVGSARSSRMQEAFARSASVGLWAGSGAAGLQIPPGFPGAVRDLLDGMADTLLSEAASTGVRGDERNTLLLVWLEEQVRDVRDQICD